MDYTYFSNVISVGFTAGGFNIYNYVMHMVNLGIPPLFLGVQFVYLYNGIRCLDFIDFRCGWCCIAIVAGSSVVDCGFTPTRPVQCTTA